MRNDLDMDMDVDTTLGIPPTNTNPSYLSKSFRVQYGGPNLGSGEDFIKSDRKRGLEDSK